MATKNITMRTTPSQILKHFSDCKSTSSINLKTSFGFIYLAGGILSKTEDNDHYIAINGRWEKV